MDNLNFKILIGKAALNVSFREGPRVIKEVGKEETCGREENIVP